MVTPIKVTKPNHSFDQSLSKELNSPELVDKKSTSVSPQQPDLEQAQEPVKSLKDLLSQQEVKEASNELESNDYLQRLDKLKSLQDQISSLQ